VYVSGAPGSGKTSLAVPLAAELGYALLTNDRIKETLHDGLGAPESSLAWSRRLGGAAMDLLWALVADAPVVVMEANYPAAQRVRTREAVRPGRAARRGVLRLLARTSRPALLISLPSSCPSICPARLDRGARGSSGRFWWRRHGGSVMANVGYTLMTEQAGPKDLVRWAARGRGHWLRPAGQQ
jgi:hypothetical protein